MLLPLRLRLPNALAGTLVLVAKCLPVSVRLEQDWVRPEIRRCNRGCSWLPVRFSGELDYNLGFCQMALLTATPSI